MEAVPKLPLISFDLKVSVENTNFGPKLKQYIAEAYREDPDSYGNEIHTLEGLRSAAVRPSIDAAGLTAMTRYFCQLRAMQSRFPMALGQPAACTFVWKDIYANVNCSLADIRYEMAAMLYNIGALHTQLGESESRTTPDSLKAACTHYQNAAWAFLHIREHYGQPPHSDMASEIMRLLQEICFAQAQECILDKSIQDTRKPSVVGAVATQVMFFYKNSLALLGPSSGSENIYDIIGSKLYNFCHRYLSFKMSYIGCVVCLYQGLNAEEQQKMGERVAFYQQAVEKLADARKLAKYIEPVQVTTEALTFTNDVVEGKRKAAKNENEFIYHEEVPEKDLLMDLKPVCLVKALPINLNDPEVAGGDVFSRLVPMGAHEASSMYSEEKAKLLRHVAGRADARAAELAEFMSSLQLDQLDVLDVEQRIPQEIVDRCAAMNAKAEIIQTLVDSMNSLAEIISDVEHSLTEIKDIIQEETMKEKEYQKVIGPRPPSIVQTELSREFHKYQEAHTRTNESNQVLHKAMTLHIANLRLLAQPLDALHTKIPSIDNIEGLDRETMMEMRRVVGKAREMQAQRDALVQQLRDAVAADDITPQLLARPSEPTDDIFRQELEKHTPKVKIIEQNLAAQENIINKLTSLYASYGDSRRLLSDVLRKREGLINALITSYDAYEELLGKSRKGLEFYRKLAHSVTQLLARLRSTCQVQAEERDQLLASQTKAQSPSPVPTTSVATKLSEVTSSGGGGSLKLKDYLPYMKNRGSRSVTPQAQVDHLPSDTYYPESIYPTSVRPAPVGSEATDVSQMKLPDGVAMPQMQDIQNPYNRYSTPYTPAESDPYAVPANYYNAGKGKDDNYGYGTSYTPPQYSTQVAEPQYSNPYYSGTQSNSTLVTDSQTVPYNNTSQANINANMTNQYNDPYAHQMVPVAESVPISYQTNQDLNVNFAQMQVNVPKSEPAGSEYSHTYYNVQYPQVSSPNNATYSNAPQTSNTTMVPSQIPSDYNSLNYPYSGESSQNQYQNPTPYNSNQSSDSTNQYAQNTVPYNQQSNETSLPNQYQNQTVPYIANQQVPNPYEQVAVSNHVPEQYSYGSTYKASEGYNIYTNADSTMTSTTSVASVPNMTAVNVPQPYALPNETDPNYINSATLAQLDATDQPIKSHVTGEAISSSINFQPTYGYDQTTVYYPNQPEQNTPKYPPTTQTQNYTANYALVDQTNVNYSQNYQNHPGYTYNTSSGSYEYAYGAQNSYTGYGNSGQANVEPQTMSQNPNWPAHGVYTSAGTNETVQSPSEAPQVVPQPGDGNNQNYYNVPYGYLTTTNQSNVVEPNTVPAPTNYGANVNQSTYMQSAQQDTTNVTFTSSQVSSLTENVSEPNFSQTTENVSKTINGDANNQNAGYTSTQNTAVIPEPSQEVPQINPVEELPESKPELSAFDLLSDIDFTVEVKPLVPEIKVPQISESAIVKPAMAPKPEPVPQPALKEEVIERPAKRDLFTDPSLLNQFTQEVKILQNLADTMTNKTASGVPVLDSKWKTFQDVQSKENMTRSKTIAMQNSGGNQVTAVVPFDDSRITLKSDPDAFINASYYKQLAPWCIPIVISKTPAGNIYSTFWKAVVEKNISCVVCLLSEIEMQGKSYWPTAKGQSLELAGDVKVTLDEVACAVHWTERRLIVASGNRRVSVTHYQIHVFPAKIVCSPLVLLADKVLSATYDNRLSNQLTGAWIQCDAGAGRSALVALLIMVMCQVRAGQLDLCDMLDAGCINLYKHRTNVLEDTKYLADAYRTALFYAQGVLCSGTTMFSGEAVSVPSGAAVLPPAPPAHPHKHKYSRESFEEMRHAPGLKSGDMKDPLNFLDPLWSLKKK